MTLTPKPARNRIHSTETYDLATEALQSYRRGIAVIAPAIGDLDKHLNASYLLHMAKTLTLDEIAQLLAASRVREEGLDKCRDGQHSDAKRLLAQAREAVDSSGMSTEARVVAASFQNAADAYLSYKTGESGAACRALLDAIHLCDVLASRYGYAVEVRRIHLARNIVHVEIGSGETALALRHAIMLVRYLDSEQSLWPFDEVASTTGPEIISFDERRMLMDQIWGEVSGLLVPADAYAAGQWRTLDNIEFRRLPESSAFRQLNAWVDAMEAHQLGDIPVFLANAANFFSSGPVVEFAWNELAATFLRAIDGGDTP